MHSTELNFSLDAWTVLHNNTQELLTELPNDTCPIPEPLEIPAIPETEGHNDMLATSPPSSNADNNYNSSQPSPQPSTSTTLPDADQTHIAGRNR